MLVWITSVSSQNTQLDTFIEGMWVASDEFCSRADIDGMMVYIGPAEDFGVFEQTRRAYIIMHSDGVIIAAKNIEISMSGFLMSPVPVSLNYKSITLTDMSDDKTSLDNIMPTSMQCELEMSQGKMSWLDGDITYAELYKTHTPDV